MSTLKQIRKSKNISKRAASLDMKVQPTFIDRVEAGEKVSLQKTKEYARYLGCEYVPVELGKAVVITFDTTNTSDTLTAYLGEGVSVVFDYNNQSVARFENGVVREVYDSARFNEQGEVLPFLRELLKF